MENMRAKNIKLTEQLRCLLLAYQAEMKRHKETKSTEMENLRQELAESNLDGDTKLG
jgi:hypothetical protein